MVVLISLPWPACDAAMRSKNLPPQYDCRVWRLQTDASKRVSDAGGATYDGMGDRQLLSVLVNETRTDRASYVLLR